MNLTVFCGASSGKDHIYGQTAAALGTWMAGRNITLVYGGGQTGIMGILADAVLSGGGTVVGIIPDFLKTKEETHTGLTQLITVHTMAERKRQLMEEGDACLAMPGGPGTLEEIAEAVSSVRLGQFNKPCIFYNIHGYYDPLEEMFDRMVRTGFLNHKGREKAIFVQSIAEIEHIIF